MKKFGFTLSEVLISMVIIGILSGAIIGTFKKNDKGIKYELSIVGIGYVGLVTEHVSLKWVLMPFALTYRRQKSSRLVLCPSIICTIPCHRLETGWAS